ncbi:MAG TPA: hypothetical protein VIY73_22025 [Polyangiaceae bacterium]
MVRGLLSAGALLGVVVLGLACASPTLPLPPPMVPDQSPGVDLDHVKLSAPCGGASPNAVIVIVNENGAVPDDQAVSGAVVTSCGSWDASVFAHTGDELEITQEIGTERSQPLDYPVQ